MEIFENWPSVKVSSCESCTYEVFVALKALVVLHFLQSSKASGVQQVNDNVWIAE